jgi:hypothetical protein
MKIDKKTIKGRVWFYLNDGYIENCIKDYTEEEKEFTGMYPTKYDIYDLFSGDEFASCVEDGGFIDYDGSISDIFVNDYVSNLGIWDYGIHQGKFCLGLNDFRELCKEYKIEVNWANK